MKQFYPLLGEILQKALKELYPDKEGLLKYISLELPKNRKFGDIASTLPLKLSSALKKKPLDIAQEIKSQIDDILADDNPGITKVEIAKPGFINFSLEDKAVKNLFMDMLRQKKSFFRADSYRVKKKILIEFVSANPTGPLSIAHGRQAVVGDVLANIFSFHNYEISREYYVNDDGTQIELFGESVKQRIKEIKGEQFSIPENGYYGEYVKDIAEKILANEDKQTDKDLDYRSIGVVLDIIRKDLKKVGVVFDSWRSQKNLSEEGKINEVVECLKKSSLTYEEEGALWFKSTLFGDSKDRVLRRKKGTFTYFAADIAYHRDKLQRGYDVLIDLWGPDHHGYISRMKAVLNAIDEKIKNKEKDFDIIIVQLVNVKKQKMSKRKGTAILLSDLIAEVGPDAVRFYYLLRKNSSHLEFDVEKALAKNFDNPLYYIQYAHARICGILDKYGEELRLDVSALSTKEEMDILKDLLNFGNILDLIIKKKEPYFLVDYLKKMASAFHKFYENNRVLVKDDPELKQSRLSLIEGVRIILDLGMKLLKVKAPQNM